MIQTPGRVAVALVLASFTILFASLEVFSYTRQSATFDEPGHLTAGYAVLADSDYRVDIEHPPLVRMWAALPLLFAHVNSVSLRTIDAMPIDTVAFGGPFQLGQRFLYHDNDADALLYRARFMIVLLGALLGVLVFSWTLEWRGWRAAIVALLLVLLEPNIAAHSALVTTDLGVACFIFGAVYFAWRTSRAWSAFNLASLVLFSVAAALTKFSGLIVLPVVSSLLLGGWFRRRLALPRVLTVVGLLVAALFAGAWAAYGFRYAPSTRPDALFTLHQSASARLAIPRIADLVAWIDTRTLLPNALAEGFLHSQGLGAGRPAYLFGEFSTFGWWYYFPVAIALKTPITLLALFALGTYTLVQRTRLFNLDAEAYLVVPILVFLIAAMAASLNIGVRHVLPIYPFMIVIAASGAESMMARYERRFAPILAAIGTAAALEFGWAYPYPLSFFNALAGGPHNGFVVLSDSNVDWGQALKPLSVWMTDHRVGKVNLAYFGTADPAYYGMNVRYIWGTIAPNVSPAQQTAPELPGYVAVSATLLDGVPFDADKREFYKPLRDRAPAADIGGSIKVYWVERPWW